MLKITHPKNLSGEKKEQNIGYKGYQKQRKEIIYSVSVSYRWKGKAKASAATRERETNRMKNHLV